MAVSTLEDIFDKHAPPVFVFFENYGRQIPKGTEKVNQGSEVERVGNVLEHGRMKDGPPAGRVFGLQNIKGRRRSGEGR